jgi:hypothetical protein
MREVVKGEKEEKEECQVPECQVPGKKVAKWRRGEVVKGRKGSYWRRGLEERNEGNEHRVGG